MPGELRHAIWFVCGPAEMSASRGGFGGETVALPDEIRAYLDDFAAGHYFEAHEQLESLWWARDSDPFLQGLILFAAAYVKVQRGHAEGARRHFLAAARYLEPYLPAHRGFDVASIVAHAKAAAGTVTPPYRFALLPGAEQAWGDAPAPGPAPSLVDAVRGAIADRRSAGDPVTEASWGALVKDVTRRTGGRHPRQAVRAAVRAELAHAPFSEP